MVKKTSGGGKRRGRKPRQTVSERYQAVALEILREAGVKRWTFHEKGLRGRGCARTKQILAPKPTTRRRLYILAHEAGHVALNHRGSKPSHRQEYEAEMYAHDALERHGIGVTEKDSQEAKKYVAYRIDQAVRMGKAKRLDHEAVEWTQRHHGAATRAALKAGTAQLVNLGSRRRRASPKKQMPKPTTIAGHIRAAADESGLSVNDIATQTGVDQSGLNRFLNGTRENVRIDIADKLLGFFGLSISPAKARRSRTP